MQAPVYYISQPMLYRDNRNWYGYKKVGGKVISKKSLRTTSKEEAIEWLNRMRGSIQDGNGSEFNGDRHIIGYIKADLQIIPIADDRVYEWIRDISKPLYIVFINDECHVVPAGDAVIYPEKRGEMLAVGGYIAPINPASLGNRGFCEDHCVNYPYYMGSMANGISSAEMVIQAANNGLLGFFGAAGLAVEEIDRSIDKIKQKVGNNPYGCNLIHSPTEPHLEMAVVDLYINRQIHLIEAAAFLTITLPLVKYRIHGIYEDTEGNIVTPNQIIAKISREEVAEKFMSPAPEALLKKLIEIGEITEGQANLARKVPMADDITAESDSAGHTDNRPAMALLPTIQSLKDRMMDKFNYANEIRVGLAGGISTPQSAAGAFAMGADYIVTGSVNQACLESGSCNYVRQLLAETRQADVAMAPSADMFEMGVTVQVLKRGTMFSMRASKLYQLYRTYNSIDEIPQEEKAKLEKTIFRATIDQTWQQTIQFFEKRDPRQIVRANDDPKHKMALIFRAYLGQSSHWANSGHPDRKVDYQIWCGPAMGAFNEWSSGTLLEKPENRKVVPVALNILYGAAFFTRINQMHPLGVDVPEKLRSIKPMQYEHLVGYLS